MSEKLQNDCLARADLGRVIAYAFAYEMPGEFMMQRLFEDMQAWDFHPLAVEGAEMIRAWLADENGEDKVETVASDYARAFLGAGIVNQVVSYPFESVYTSPTRLVMQDAYEEVRKIYHKSGFVKTEDCDMHEDHIALEVQFLAHMSARQAQCIAVGETAGAIKALEVQKDFIQKHIDNWVPRFFKDLRESPVSPFYKGWSFILEGFIEFEKQAIEDILQCLR